MRAVSHALVALVIAATTAACGAESSGSLAVGGDASTAAQGGGTNGVDEGTTRPQSPQDASLSDPQADAAGEPVDVDPGPLNDTSNDVDTEGGSSAPPEADGATHSDDVQSTEDGQGHADSEGGDDATTVEGDATSVSCADDEVIDCLGGCSPTEALGDKSCDAALDCELLGFDSGDCTSECGDLVCAEGESYESCPEDCPEPITPTNHPCELSDAPGSNDLEVTDCVCALDAWCCSNTWDAFCVQLAEESCQAPCDCTTLECEASTDCQGCFGDACVGMWSCVEGLCVQAPPVLCENDPASGCLLNQCDPESGACVTSPSDSLCDDQSACTSDSCDPQSGLCVYAGSGLCGAQHPCETSESPGTSDEVLMACLCEVDPYCCQTAWDQACVAGVTETCGLSCDCATAPPEDLACELDADCTWCGEGACTGAYLCADGRCEPSAPVVCDDADDTSCSKSTCDPATGACAMMTSDTFCDDDDPCTLDVCQGEAGECEHTAIEGCGETHPCQPGTAPLSSDDEVNACTCAQETSCCEGPWSETCVATAQQSCGLECDCQALEPEALSCMSNTDCAYCDDDDLCNGTWLCQSGTCVATAPVSCDTSLDSGCLLTACVPSTGACEQGMVEVLCDDGDPCTEDLCDTETGECLSEANPACGANHPCVSAPLPTSSDPIATACVCEINPYCCSGAWDATCVAAAEAQCGQVCTCDDPDAPVICVEDAECAGCDDGDLCNGTWGCVDGICGALDMAVSCPSDQDMGCLINSCAPMTGLCELSPSDAACDDGDLCTADTCTEEGACLATPIEGCALSHPCAASSTPQSTDAEITACVCAIDPWCCDNNWDGICVDEAISECGAICDCTDPASEASCNVDADCGWCSDSLCDTPWACSEGLCVEVGAAVDCDSSEDTECLSNQCQPESGACAMVVTPGACDDDDPCTMDSCGPDGACTHEVLVGCEGVPPFECLGTSEPSADGCGIVESYEGCCDPWGRVTWCQDGKTYCIACQENPSCGWQDAQGYYDCGNDATEDPSGAAPMMCPAYGP